MDNSKDTIRDLLLLKVTGSLTPAEELVINALIEEDPEVRALWEATQSDFASPEQQQAMESFDTKSFISDIKSTMERRKQQKSIKAKVMLCAAAAVLGASIFIFTINKGRTPQKAAIANAATIGPTKNIYLKLANGKIVDLSDTGKVQTIDAGDITLNNANNTLTYTAKGGGNGLSTLVVPPGKEYNIKLADGTSVRLNSGTSLQFPFGFSGSSREIIINGEAYLDVAPDMQRPFIVHTPQADIQVLGTAFNVNSYNPEKITVSLVQGSVKLKAGEQDVLLKPGYAADFTQQKGFSVHTFDKDEVLSWLNGRYIFSNATLGQIIPILQRWYGVEIVLDNKVVSGKVFTGQVNKTDSINVFLDMLKVIRDADYYYQGNIIHIK